MNAWLWFVISAVAAIAGVSLLMLDRGQNTSHSRERRRWAGLRGWSYSETDPAIAGRWQHGVFARGVTGAPSGVVAGSLFTGAGKRVVHVFDLAGPPAAVVVAVQRRAASHAVLELWLPTVEFPQQAGLDLLGPVGDRYAFTSDLATARPLVTPDLVALADDIGDDVPVLWLEDAWVVATVAPGTAPSRLERLLRLLGDVADLVDDARDDATSRRAAGDPPLTDPRGFAAVDPDAPAPQRGGEPATSPADTSRTDVLAVPDAEAADADTVVAPAAGSEAPKTSAPADADPGDGSIDDEATPQDATPAPTNAQTFGPTAAGAAASAAAMTRRPAPAEAKATADEFDDDEADSWIDDPAPIHDEPRGDDPRR